MWPSASTAVISCDCEDRSAVGSVIGVAFMRGMGVLDLRVIRNILYSWFITLPFTLALAMVFYKLFEWVLL